MVLPFSLAFKKRRKLIGNWFKTTTTTIEIKNLSLASGLFCIKERRRHGQMRRNIFPGKNTEKKISILRIKSLLETRLLKENIFTSNHWDEFQLYSLNIKWQKTKNYCHYFSLLEDFWGLSFTCWAKNLIVKKIVMWRLSSFLWYVCNVCTCMSNAS